MFVATTRKIASLPFPCWLWFPITVCFVYGFRYSGQVYDIRQLIVFTNRMYLSCECVHPSVYLLMSFIELIPANWQPKFGVAESAKKLREYKQREARRMVAIKPWDRPIRLRAMKLAQLVHIRCILMFIIYILFSILYILMIFVVMIVSESDGDDQGCWGHQPRLYRSGMKHGQSMWLPTPAPLGAAVSARPLIWRLATSKNSAMLRRQQKD